MFVFPYFSSSSLCVALVKRNCLVRVGFKFLFGLFNFKMKVKCSCNFITRMRAFNIVGKPDPFACLGCIAQFSK